MLIFGGKKTVCVILNFSVFVLLTLLVGVFSRRIGEECVLNDGEVGYCEPYSKCRSAIRLVETGVKPIFCDDEGESSLVCCEVKRRTGSNGSRRHYKEEEESRRGAKRWTSTDDDNSKIVSIFDAQNAYRYDSNNSERKKHSITPDLNDGTSRNEYNRRKHYSNEPSYYTEETTRYKQPSRWPGNSDGKIVDPGLQEDYTVGEHYKKKKPHSDYQYEYVTKKPYYDRTTKKVDHYDRTTRRVDNYDRTTRRYDNYDRTTKRVDNYDWESENENRKTTKRYQWGDGTTTKKYDWYEDKSTTRRYDPWENQNQNQHTTKKVNNNYYYEETTKRNQWQNQNNWSIEENTGDFYGDRTSTTTRRPYRTTTRDSYVPPTDYRPTSRPHDSNNRPEVNKRISEIKCLEYAKEVTVTIAGLPLTADPKPVKINVQNCINPQQLIVGGENTTVGEFPHMAAVGFRDHAQRGIAWNCGGSLISDEFVLTAAHCTSTSMGPPVMVRLGEFNLKRNDDGAHPVDYSIKEIIKHPDYKPPSKYNDIALLRLSRRVSFHKNIRPACLYTKDTFTTNKTIATGWGRIDYAEDPSETLLKVALSIIDNQHCNRLYHNTVRSEVLSNGIVNTQMCAGELAGGKDTCQGDSGGPIEITSKSNQCVHHIIGITSFGKHCAQPNAPGVYTRVSSYVPWIESIVWPQRG